GDALPFLDTARELAPNLSDPYLELGTAHWALKNWDEAEENLKKATRLNPKDEYGWWRYGYVLMKKEKWAEAEKALNRALRIDGDLAEAWLDLGHVLRKRGDDDQALLAYRRAFETDPSYTAAFEEFASAAEELGDDTLKEYISVWKAHEAKKFGDADKKIRDLLEKDAENTRYHLLLGHVLFHQTPPKALEAVTAYEKCLEMEKKEKKADKLPTRSRSLALEGIGMAHLIGEDLKKAKDAFSRGLKVESDYPGHSYYLAVVAARDGKSSTVFKRLREVREKDFDGGWVKRAREDKEFEIFRERKGFFEALEGE
ncbi:MAG: tetratricopeptide repeat protein, partial [Planctomycetota bacterium]